MFLRKIEKHQEKVSKIRNISGGFKYRTNLKQIWNLLNILRVFRLGTRLKVYRALDIQKLLGHPMGGWASEDLCARPSEIKN